MAHTGHLPMFVAILGPDQKRANNCPATVRCLRRQKPNKGDYHPVAHYGVMEDDVPPKAGGDRLLHKNPHCGP
tara:strand:+ start:744 stop:962 length:219 start_codon:yes stop_codon:yes gene_type:complete